MIIVSIKIDDGNIILAPREIMSCAGGVIVLIGRKHHYFGGYLGLVDEYHKYEIHKMPLLLREMFRRVEW